jgi:hypothetical protein
MLFVVLPPQLAQNSDLAESLDLVLSFDTWRRLRKDQRLAPAKARRVVEHLVSVLAEGAPA